MVNIKMIKKMAREPFISSNEEKYVGEWKDDLKHGQGTLTSSDGSKYEGAWKDDLKHGQGTLTSSDGSKYEGAWKDDMATWARHLRHFQMDQNILVN